MKLLNPLGWFSCPYSLSSQKSRVFTAILGWGGRDKLGVRVRFKMSREKYSLIPKIVSVLHGRTRDGLWQTPIRNFWCFMLVHHSRGLSNSSIHLLWARGFSWSSQAEAAGFVGCLTPSCKADTNHFCWFEETPTLQLLSAYGDHKNTQC